MSDPLAAPNESFSAVVRVYGERGYACLRGAHVCVVGLGGVGSWAVEALARSGVGQLTIIDHDDISLSNINRQIHATMPGVGSSKAELMAQRVGDINPDCECRAIDDMLVLGNLEKYISLQLDYVVDAIDSIKFKTALIYHCKRNRIPVITTGGAGGLTDPTAVQIADLTRTWNDPLAAKVRKRLRSDYGWSANPKRRFGVECVYSPQQALYPTIEGGISRAKPGTAGLTLDCDTGYGSLVGVTAMFGMTAASRVMNKLAQQAQRVID